jgi:transcriptional regulator with XRE-family HTH domain
MLTEFGKAVRKIRIEREEYLGNMAEKLGVSPAFLSAVENGRRKVPHDWYNRIAGIYSINDIERRQLETAVANMNNGLFIDMTDKSADEKDAALAFAFAFHSSDTVSKSKIMEIQKLLQR